MFHSPRAFGSEENGHSCHASVSGCDDGCFALAADSIRRKQEKGSPFFGFIPKKTCTLWTSSVGLSLTALLFDPFLPKHFYSHTHPSLACQKLHWCEPTWCRISLKMFAGVAGRLRAQERNVCAVPGDGTLGSPIVISEQEDIANLFNPNFLKLGVPEKC